MSNLYGSQNVPRICPRKHFEAPAYLKCCFNLVLKHVWEGWRGKLKPDINQRGEDYYTLPVALMLALNCPALCNDIYPSIQ